VPNEPCIPDARTLRTELLLSGCHRGDRAAIEQVVREWEARLLYYVRRLVRDEQDAWDVLQQTWVNVLRGVRSVREATGLAPWLYRVARNAAFNHSKALKAEARHLHAAVDAAAIPPNGQPEPDIAADAEAVHAALNRLTLAHRDVLTLYFLRDLNIEQIADVLGVPAGTVKSRIYYAKAALREALSASDGSLP
jgi:RNA polymerase sigma-70 factor, ECF subfamily